MAFRHLVHMPQAQDRNKEQQERKELFGKPQMFMVKDVTEPQHHYVQGEEKGSHPQGVGQDLPEECPGAAHGESPQGAEHDAGESRQQDAQDFPVEGEFDFPVVSASPFFFFHAVPFLKIFCWSVRFP